MTDSMAVMSAVLRANSDTLTHALSLSRIDPPMLS